MQDVNASAHLPDGGFLSFGLFFCFIIFTMALKIPYLKKRLDENLVLKYNVIVHTQKMRMYISNFLKAFRRNGI